MGYYRDLMDRELRIRGYAESTRKLYLFSVRELVRHFMRSPDTITLDDIKDFQLHLIRERKLSRCSHNIHVCAIRFFYRHVLDKDWKIERIPYHRRPQRLPVILSSDEVRGILRAPDCLKHRVFLAVAYSAGLRVSEVRRLRIGDIDSERMTIRVTQSKRNKDRDVMLSKKLLEILRIYWRVYRTREWLFENSKTHQPLSSATFHAAFRKAKIRADIQKCVKFHSLRHAFATHLLEGGTNIRVIQRLLGHCSLSSTEIYTHVASTFLKETESPLDKLLDGDSGDHSDDED